jgi:hypothetical protein
MIAWLAIFASGLRLLVAGDPILREHQDAQHAVIRREGCELCQAADPPPAETVVGRLVWDPRAGPYGGLVYRPEPPDETGDWLQIETSTGQLVYRRGRVPRR